MRRILLSFLSALLLSGVARAQIPVTDAANITQSIVNSVTELVQTSTTAENMIGNFKETMKIYRQGKEYYDRLRNVTHLVRDARKVQQSILLVGELSDIYVTSYDKMLTDDNFSSQELSAIAAGYNTRAKTSPFRTCVRSGKTIRSGCWIYTVRRTKNIGSYGNAFI